MKQTLPFLFFLGAALIGNLYGQQLTLKKGSVIDSLVVNDSITESFSLYIPTSFENQKSWPVLFVFDLEGRGKQALHMFKDAAEKHGYLLASSNSIRDTIPLSNNVLIANRMFNRVFDLFQIHRDRVYTAGFGSGGKFASTIPTFIKEVDGVISCSSAIPNTELLNSKNPFYFIGLVGTGDYNYPPMRNTEKTLNRLKFPNQLLLFEGGRQWPPDRLLNRALEIFTISAIGKGDISKDEDLLKQSFEKRLSEMQASLASRDWLNAYDLLLEINSVYRAHFNIDSLQEKRKELKRDKFYRTKKRNQNNIFFRESLIKEDYLYYLEEDLLTYNFNNLGWWNYQVGELEKYQKSNDKEVQKMGKRLDGFLNALVEDEIIILNGEEIKDEEGLIFLWMLKTITAPKTYDSYLKIISTSSKYEDYGTALFYLEELLKNGYTDEEELYSLEHSALLRISPDFNKIINKYLKGARYEIKEE